MDPKSENLFLQVIETFFYYMFDYFLSSLFLFSLEIPISWILELLSIYHSSLCPLGCLLEDLHTSVFMITDPNFYCVYSASQSIYTEILNIIVEVETQNI